MNVRQSLIIGWLRWAVLLLIATIVLIQSRSDIDLASAVMTMILIALGGSAAGGRVLGFTLVVAGFLIIGFYFQHPYGALNVDKPFDVLVLIAFVASAGLSADRLARAHQDADAARQRTSEVESLSRLGAATLRYAEPSESLTAIADLVCETVGGSACLIFRPDGAHGLIIANRAAADADARTDSRLERVAALAVDTGAAVTLSSADICVTHEIARFTESTAPLLVTTVLALPLRADERTIGALVVRGKPVLQLDAALRRLLAALGYYAAIGLERARLFEQAAHTEALREANRAKDEILASVSHDLRTPLTTIKVLAQSADASGESTGAAIVEQADRLERMVRDLLDLSRLRSGSSAVTADLNTTEDLFGAAVRQAAGVLDGKRVVPHVDLGSPALVGSFDFVHTLRILGNLVDNALRYTAQGGTVDLGASRDGSALVITVGDRGPGVDVAERERIFEAFYRPAGAMPDAGRSGLGLSIARTLADLQGGSLTYAPREGGGSLFTLRVPAADVEEMS